MSVRPVLTTLQLGDATIPIGGYGALLVVALAAGAAVALWSARRANLELGGFIAAMAAAVGCGFAGALGLFAAVEWLRTEQLPATPGLVFYGGALAGALGFATVARLHRLPPLAALDALLPALPIGHAIGRVGCLLGGCCFGEIWDGPFAIVYTDPLAPAAHPSLPRHPWPIYEALILLALAAWIARNARGLRAGQASARYVLAYAVLRFALEPLRGDVVRGIGYLSTSQWISIGLAGLAGLAALWAKRRASDFGLRTTGTTS